jgi:hypothetical protein
MAFADMKESLLPTQKVIVDRPPEMEDLMQVNFDVAAGILAITGWITAFLLGREIAMLCWSLVMRVAPHHEPSRAVVRNAPDYPHVSKRDQRTCR